MSLTWPDPHQQTSAGARLLLKGLLPRFYWHDDGDHGPLAELVDVLADQYMQLHANLDTLYANLFIETCAEPIIPYIAQSIGVRGLGPAPRQGVSHRAWVGRVIGLRARKGSLATLGRAVTAATGWPVFVTAGRALTGQTQSLLYPRAGLGGFVDIGDVSAVTDAPSPFSTLARMAQISGYPYGGAEPAPARQQSRGGHPRPQTAEVSVWRVQAFPVTQRTAYRVDAVTGGFTFHPAGVDSPLFVPSQSTTDPLMAPSRSEIPMPLSAAALSAALADGSEPLTIWTEDEASPPNVVQVASEQIVAGGLSHWSAPSHPEAEVIVDPELGRLLFTGRAPAAVQVDYSYGFLGELGGGPYGPPSDWKASTGDVVALHVSVPSSGGAATSPNHYPSLDAALQAAASQAEQASQLGDALQVVITIDDSATYGAPTDGWQITLQKNQSLRIESAAEAAPALDGAVTINGGELSRLELSGLLLTQTVNYDGPAGVLAIEHSTVPPTVGGGLRMAAGAVSISYSILGRIELAPGSSLSIRDSIIDGLGDHAVIADRGRSAGQRGATADIERTTVFGETTVDVITAQDSIFTGRVIARQPDSGLISFSFLPTDSSPPQLIECEPSRRTELDESQAPVLPRFTSMRYGDPGYARLAESCDEAITMGAEGTAEMGAFNWLAQSFRVTRLLDVLTEMLPAGRVASVVYRS